MREGEAVDLDDLIDRARAAADRYERYASADVDADEMRRHEGTSGVRTETVGTILAQVLHHGNEHRSQIGTILGAHGVVHPEYSGWAWGKT
jgi:uncharacterized damage-inducible protein DinB